ncbi:MAG: hypothetical protein IKN89_12680 [Oscillospiraceae bacterium]|nr:hypothetical protein [Oscillospiraceae bacterium]
MTIKTDPTFQNVIPPLTEEEYSQLRDNILSDGEVYEPIITWNGTIIDGHNRWRIIREHWEELKDKYHIREMDFPDRWAAFDWMYRKPLGRRNLTEEQRAYMIGKMYDARKHGVGGQTGNSNARKRTGHGDPIVSSADAPGRTDEEIGAEQGIGSRTVRRANEFSQGVDALREVSPDAAEKVLTGEAEVPWRDIRAIPKLEPEMVKELADSIVSGESSHRQIKMPRGGTKEQRKAYEEIAEIERDMYDRSTVPEYNIDLLADDIRLSAEVFSGTIRQTLTELSFVLTEENKSVVIDVIDRFIIKDAERLIGQLQSDLDLFLHSNDHITANDNKRGPENRQ